MLAVLIAGGLALAARKGRALTDDGAIAAVVVGTASAAAGWGWVALLLVFFVTSTTWSRIGRVGKEARTSGVVSKGDERDAQQVLANGGAFAIAAAGSVSGPPPLVRTGRGRRLCRHRGHLGDRNRSHEPCGTPIRLDVAPVIAGTSGGVTAIGTAASAAAMLIALAAIGVGWPRSVAWGAVAGGLAGSALDSLLGATVQARRWCAHCAASTERVVHGCGEPTQHAGGIRWLDNDGVNAINAVAGAVVAWGVAGSLS